MQKNLRNNLQFLLKNTSIIFIVKIIGMGLGFILQILFGKILGPNYYGQYTIFITVINLFNIVTVLGMDSSLIREIPRIKENDLLRKRLLKQCIIFTIILTITIIFLMYILKKPLCDFFKVTSNQYFIFILLILFVTSVSKIFDGYLQGDKKTIAVSVFTTIGSNSTKLAIFILLYYITNKKLLAAVISYLISEIILLICRYKYAKSLFNRQCIKKNTRYSLENYKYFFKYSFSLFAISAVNIIIHNVDKIAINTYVNSTYVGIYKVAESYIGIISIFTAPFVIFWPMISKLYKDNEINMLNDILKYITKIITMISMPMIILMIIFSKDLLAIFGYEYIVGYKIFYVLLIGSIFDALAGPVGAVLNMSDYAKYNLANTIFVAILDIILNILLVSKFGAIGAAISTSISLIMLNLLSIIENKILLNVYAYDYQNLYLIICSLFIFVIDKVLYFNISINIYIKMITFIILNYILFIIMFLYIIKSDYKEIYNQLIKKR